MFGRCSCPVGDGCKHSLALLITVRDEQAAGLAAGCPALGAAAVLAARRARRAGAERLQRVEQPLALQVDLKPPARSTGLPRLVREVTSARGTLRMRPMRRGARDNWVRSGISWTDVPYLDRNGAHPPEQVVALNDLLSGHRMAMRQLYFGADGNVALGVLRAREVPLRAAGGRGRDAAAAPAPASPR